MAIQASPLAAAVQKVGDRWTLLVVEALLDGPRRYNELQDAIPGIATNVLSQRLKHLEREGLVRAELYSTRPARHAYALTPAGAELVGALRLLAAWGAEHGEESEAPAHTLCGTSLEARWYCPTCDVPVDDTQADALRYV
jgi:DNA-binding HxlR family transcriptional regulator